MIYQRKYDYDTWQDISQEEFEGEKLRGKHQVRQLCDVSGITEKHIKSAAKTARLPRDVNDVELRMFVDALFEVNHD